MTERIEYYANKRFKYDGKIYEPGAKWTPKGHRRDSVIRESRLVHTKIVKVATRRRKPRVAKGAK